VTPLTEFLAARLDEDREAATKAGGREWAYNGHIWLVVDHEGDPVVYDEGKPNWFQASHIVRHDPARVLREVAAKRALLEEFELPGLDCAATSAAPDNCRQHRVLRQLAAIYSDHSDFREEWALGIHTPES